MTDEYCSEVFEALWTSDPKKIVKNADISYRSTANCELDTVN